MEEKKEPRISGITIGLMIGVAVICDLLGPFGAVGAVPVFFIWFKLKNVPIFSAKQVGKQLANLGLNALGETLSAGVWAGVTVGVIITIALSRLEDKLGVSFDVKSALENPGQTASKIGERLAAPGGAPKAANDNEAPSEHPRMNDMKPSAPRSNVMGGADRSQRSSAVATPKAPVAAVPRRIAS